MSRESLAYWKRFFQKHDSHIKDSVDCGKPHKSLTDTLHANDGDIVPEYSRIERPEVDPWTGRDNPSNPASAFKAPEATQIERPDVPNYAGEQYEKKIDLYRDAYYDVTSTLEAADPNLATRVVKGLDEIEQQHIDKVTGANTWFDRKLREIPHVLHTLTFATDGHGSVDIPSFQGYPYDEVTVTVTPDAHYQFVSWSDGVTANPRTFTVGRYDQTFTAQMKQDPKYTLTFFAGDYAVCRPSGYVGYEGDTVTVEVVLPFNAYYFEKWDDENTDNPRTFTVGTESKRYNVITKNYPHLTFNYDSSTDVNTIKLGYGDNMEISTDNLFYTSWDKSETTVTGDCVYVRGKSGSTKVADFGGNFTSVSGEVMSLVDYTDTSVTPVKEQFLDGGCGLFGISWGTPSASSLRDASGLIGPSVVSEACMNFMFGWNQAIVKGPQLPAPVLAKICYQNMFYQCHNLNEVHCDATDISAYNCTYSWLPNVSSTGDFYGKQAAGWWRGSDGIPPNWTAHLD